MWILYAAQLLRPRTRKKNGADPTKEKLRWSCSFLKVWCCQAKKRTPGLPCCFSHCALPKPRVFSLPVNPYVIQWDMWVSQFLGLGLMTMRFWQLTVWNFAVVFRVPFFMHSSSNRSEVSQGIGYFRVCTTSNNAEYACLCNKDVQIGVESMNITPHIGARKQQVCKKMCGHSQRCLTMPCCKIGSGFPPAVVKCLCTYKCDSWLQYLQIICFYCGLFILISYKTL